MKKGRIGFMLLSAVFFCCSCASTKTRPFKDGQGHPIPNSIASLEKIKVGGVDQWILIRGRNINNPILFKLHGGPGQAEMATASYNRALEENFIVVEWDQRGAGKSFRAIDPASSMTIAQLVEDTREISEYLRQRFHRKKLILVGHSWGSVLGMLAVKKYPQLYSAFVSTGQIVNMAGAAKLSYQYLLDEAKRTDNDTALEQLTALGPPPYDGGQGEQKRKVYRKWMDAFSAGWHGKEPLPRIKLMLSAVEYSYYEKFNYLPAARRSFDLLYPELMKTNLFEQVKSVDVPVYFCAGRFDHQTPTEITLEYFDQLQAPVKKWQWFENSAHFPFLEEPGAFNDFLMGTVLKGINKETL